MIGWPMQNDAKRGPDCEISQSPRLNLQNRFRRILLCIKCCCGKRQGNFLASNYNIYRLRTCCIFCLTKEEELIRICSCPGRVICIC